jgi:hypothetical protein
LLLQDEPDRSFLHFHWILGFSSHGHILSRVCASGKFGPVQEIIASLAEKLEITKDDKKLSAWTTPMDRTPSG